MSKRIAIIRNAYAHDFGGGERFPVFLAKSLDNFGYEPTIISRNPKLLAFATDSNLPTIRGWWWKAQNWSGRRVIFFPLYAAWQALLYLWYLHMFISLKPEVVHIQSKDDFIAATYAAKHLGIRVVWTDHADLKHVWQNIQVPLKNPVGKWVYRAALHADSITAVSKSEMSEITARLKAESPVHERMTVVYNGCADVLSEYPPAAHDDFTYGIASRLVEDKGISEAIQAFTNVHKKFKNTRLVIAGDGPDYERFAAQAAGVDAIEFIGHQRDPYRAISSIDVFLHPTYHEGFSVVLVEACMLQKPIIATNVGGNVEIIHEGQTGLLVPPQDAVSLCQAMERLYGDTVLRDALAKSARKQYEKQFIFDEIVKERFIPLYDKTTD